MNDLPYYVGFSYFLGIGPIRFNILQKAYPSIKDAYNAPRLELEKLIGVVVAQKFVSFRASFQIESELRKFEKDDIKVLTQEDSRFPQSFRHLEDSPICIYIKGDLSAFDLQEETFFGVVGTRKPTPYGAQVTQYFTKSLARAGFIIVSGMALGVDAIAHRSALDEGGKTVAILGCGVQIVYPPTNRKIYEEILEKGNIIMSEFPPYMTVKPGLFISRNRLVSAISKGVLITEGLRESGSLITARFASEQGKDVFAVPGSIFSEESQAPHFLIKRGACLVTTPEEIYEELGMRYVDKNDLSQLKLTADEVTVVNLLKSSTLDIDEISTALSVPVYKIMTFISSLEIQGVIEKNELGKYQIKR